MLHDRILDPPPKCPINVKLKYTKKTIIFNVSTN